MSVRYIFSTQTYRYRLTSRHNLVAAIADGWTNFFISLSPARSCRGSPRCTEDLVSKIS